MQDGSPDWLTQWMLIGATLGFVDAANAADGPQVAARLKQVYTMCLCDFDMACIDHLRKQHRTCAMSWARTGGSGKGVAMDDIGALMDNGMNM